MVLLDIKALRIRYGRKEVIKGISMSVDVGTIATLIGSNGAGKSTVLKTISGLKEPTVGEVLFNGRRIDGLPPHEIIRLGIAQVPEGRHLFPRMTVLENLEMGTFLKPKGKGLKKDLEQVYSHFPILKERAKQPAGSLSGGEQQMLAVGRALMATPKLLLLDEPSLGLAPMMVAEIGRIITDIRQRGITIILVEQNAFMALKIADKGYVLETGSIVLADVGEALLYNEHVKKAYLGG
jgi:branched-chain amino acid transport system ATP-binding protein